MLDATTAVISVIVPLMLHAACHGAASHAAAMVPRAVHVVFSLRVHEYAAATGASSPTLMHFPASFSFSHYNMRSCNDPHLSSLPTPPTHTATDESSFICPAHAQAASQRRGFGGGT